MIESVNREDDYGCPESDALMTFARVRKCISFYTAHNSVALLYGSVCPKGEHLKWVRGKGNSEW